MAINYITWIACQPSLAPLAVGEPFLLADKPHRPGDTRWAALRLANPANSGD